MGSTLSQQEKLFVKCEWINLMMEATDMENSEQAISDELAVKEECSNGKDSNSDSNGEDDDSEIQSIPTSRRERLKRRLGSTLADTARIIHGATSRAHKVSEFVMSPYEWQALLSLAEEANPTAIPSILVAKKKPMHCASDHCDGESLLSIDWIKAPFVACVSHVAAIAERQIEHEVGLDRLLELQMATVKRGTVLARLGTETQTTLCMAQHEAKLTEMTFLLSQLVFCGLNIPNNNDKNKNSEIVVNFLEKVGKSVTAVSCTEATAALTDNRPVYSFALRYILAVLLAFACEQGIKYLLQDHVCVSSSTKNSNEVLRSQRYISEIIKSLTLRGIDHLRKFDAMMKAHGYTPINIDRSMTENMNDNSSHVDIFSDDSSVCLNFQIVKRLERRLQAYLLTLDLVFMTTEMVLPSPPERPTSWESLPKSYVGQSHIIESLQRHFNARKRGIVEDNKPTVLLFFGQSGHGKSELAKSISKVLHPNTKDVEAAGKLVMIHLPSFCTKDSIYSLVDPPAAHVGEGMLLSALRKENDAVIVLDEFEKSTPDSIQNLWLSAFQKDGMLRSLKDPSRSTTTTKATFILTCNICDSLIADAEAEYLEACFLGNEWKKQDMQQRFITACKENVKLLLGEPFLNRVDFFFPFMPYTLVEKERYASLQLAHICRQQAVKFGRYLILTPSYLTSVASVTRNFHTCYIEEQAREVLYAIPDGSSTGQNNTSEFIEGNAQEDLRTRIAHTFPRVCSSSSNTNVRCDSYNCDFISSFTRAFELRELNKFLNHICSTSTSPHRYTKTDSDNGIRGGVTSEELEHLVEEAAVAQRVFIKGGVILTHTTGKEQHDTTLSPENNHNGCDGPKHEDPADLQANTSATTIIASSGLRHRSRVDNPQHGGKNSDQKEKLMHLEKVKTRKTQETAASCAAPDSHTVDLSLDTVTVKELSKQVDTLREQLLEKNKEITMLKDTITQLQKLVGLLMCFSLAVAMTLCMIMGLEAGLVLIGITSLCMYLLVDNIWSIIVMSVRALYQFLGPAKFTAFVTALVGYVSWAMFRSYSSRLAPCDVCP